MTAPAAAASALRRVVIVGSGVSAWTTAAALGKYLAGYGIEIVVIADSSVPSPAGGLSTVPSISHLHRALKLTDAQLLAPASHNAGGCGSYKLGTAYQDWVGLGHQSTHTFSPIGEMLDAVEFHHYLSRLASHGAPRSLEAFSIAAAAARQQRFGPLAGDPQSPLLAQLVPALHLDQTHYCQLLRNSASANRVQSIDGVVTRVELDPTSGFIATLNLTTGQAVSADFVFDCSGVDSVIQRALGNDFVGGSHWLPCDQRLDVVRKVDATTPLLTCLRRSHAGWNRTIPLPGRRFEQHSFSSQWQDADQLRDGLGPDLAKQAVLYPLSPGYRQRPWDRNCLSIGSTAGFAGDFVIDPAHVVQSAALRWLDLLPDRHCDQTLARQYNSAARREYERVLDIHLLHLRQATSQAMDQRASTAASQPADSVPDPSAEPFWRAVAETQWPESLNHRLELFREIGKVAVYEGDPLASHAWVSLFAALGVTAKRYDRLADGVDQSVLEQHLAQVAELVEQTAQRMPAHDETLTRYLA